MIPADKTILDVLIEAGEDPLHDCKRGECGICQVGVIEGSARPSRLHPVRCREGER